MFRLIQNEYIKTFRKVSTIIILAMVILASVGLVAIAKFSDVQSKKYEEQRSDMSFDDGYASAIQDAKDIPYVGSELDIEKWEYLVENNIQEFFSSQSGGNRNWRAEATDDLFSFSGDEENGVKYDLPEETRTKLDTIIKNKDWKGYCEYKVETLSKLPNGENAAWEYNYRLEKNLPLVGSNEETTDWRNIVITNVSEAKANLVDENEITDSETESMVKEAEEIIAIGIYRLDNNKPVNVADSESLLDGSEVDFWSVLGTSTSLISLIGLLIIVLTGSSLANEFSRGTIKFLLINPVKRWKILISKYLTCISLGYVMLILMFACTSLFTAMVFGTSDLSAQYITYVNGAIQTSSGWVYLIKQYLVGSVNVVVMATLAFAISSLVRSAALSIGIGIFAMLTGNTLVLMLKGGLHQDWARYLIFANTNLNSVISGSTLFGNHTLGFAITVIAVHMVVFMLIAWDGFVRREV